MSSRIKLLSRSKCDFIQDDTIFLLYRAITKRHDRAQPMPKPKSPLIFQIELSSWKRIPGLETRLQKAAHAALTHLPKKFSFPATATVLLTGNAKIRQLNHDFRGMNKPTNVLSFPQYEPAQLARLGGKKDTIELGDIALGYQYIVAEAKKDHKLLINHLTHLILHGLLHLFGYDHMTMVDAEHMEKLERKIMASLGLPDPYAAAPAIKTRKQ